MEQKLSFCGEILCSFQTDNQEFFRFVEQAHGLKPENGKSGNPDLDVRIYFHKKNPISLNKKLAHNVFFDDGQTEKILYQDRGFSVYAEQGKPFRITAYVKGDIPRDVYYAFRYGVKKAKRGKYLEVVRKSLFLPLFYLLTKKEYILLHGSAVVNPESDKAFLFLGANYVGKTTIALNLVYNHKFAFVSDNYILTKGNKLYPFPENVRGKMDILSMLSIPGKLKGEGVNEKYFFNLPIQKILTPWTVTKAFFMQLGPEPKITKIDSASALKRLNACHSHVNELPESSYLAFFSDFPAISVLQERLENFLQSQELYVFQFSPDISDSTKELLEKMN